MVVLAHLLHLHEPRLLILAALVSFLTALTAITVWRRRAAPGSPRRRAVLAGVTFGAGAWTTHFIAMLAFDPGVPVAYDIFGTFFSVGLGMAASACAFALLQSRAFAAGLVLGLGIAALHYVGMSALRVPGRVDIGPAAIILSVAVGIAFSIAAGAVARSEGRGGHRAVAAALLVGAVYGLHMVGMAGLTVTPDPVADASWAQSTFTTGALSPGALALVLTLGSLLIGIITVGISLVDDHLAQRSEREAERLRGLAEATTEGVLIEVAGVAVEANSALCALLGRDRAAVVGWMVADLLPTAVHRGAGEGMGPRTVELRAASEARIVEVSTRPAEHGGAPARIWSLRDVTERRRYEAVRETETRLLEATARDHPLPEILEVACRSVEAALPGARTSIMLVDEDGKTLHLGAGPRLSASYRRAVDGIAIAPGAGVCGTAAYLNETVVISDVETDPRVEAWRMAVRREGIRACWATPLVARDGRVLGTLTTYHAETYHPSAEDLAAVGRIAAVVSVAVEHQRLRADLVAARDRAEAASRAKSEFLASMSHELRTPLNAILGFSELIEADAGTAASGSRAAEYAADIHRSGRHLLAVINDILDVARIEAGRFDLAEERCDVVAVTTTQAGIVRHAFPEAPPIRIDQTTTPPLLLADERALAQILLNLLGNAAKFTPPEGQITVSFDSTAPGMRIRIRDTGPGIPRELLPELGQPFRQAGLAYSRPKGGTGLGLYICRSLAEAHGGQLTIESEPGEGTCVTLALPERRVIREAAAG